MREAGDCTVTDLKVDSGSLPRWWPLCTPISLSLSQYDLYRSEGRRHNEDHEIVATLNDLGRKEDGWRGWRITDAEPVR